MPMVNANSTYSTIDIGVVQNVVGPASGDSVLMLFVILVNLMLAGIIFAHFYNRNKKFKDWVDNTLEAIYDRFCYGLFSAITISVIGLVAYVVGSDKGKATANSLGIYVAIVGGSLVALVILGFVTKPIWKFVEEFVKTKKESD
jgi:hypothetical protein